MSEIEIKQADRNAAARCEESLYAMYGRTAAAQLSAHTRAGGRDHGKWVKEFARHRHEARAEALEEAARVAERPFQPIDIGGCLIMDTDQTEIIATAIRALRSGEREG